MLIPSIDLMGGKIVQLVQGEKKSLEFDDFAPWIEKFRAYPLVQLIDVDAAIGTGNNRERIADLVRQLPCQVGGGIRTAGDAERLLSAGARRVIFGSALFDEDKADVSFAHSLAAELPRERLTFAVDARRDQVAVRGWRRVLPLSPAKAIQSLEDYCSAFLYTHIDTEGMMCGIPMDKISALRAATSRKLICAGGIRTWEEIERLDAMEMDAVVGMAIYAGLIQA